MKTDSGAEANIITEQAFSTLSNLNQLYLKAKSR